MPLVKLIVSPDGVVEIWRANEIVGSIEPTETGLLLAMGDAEPPPGVTLVWGGEPFSMRFEFAAEASTPERQARR